MIQDGTLTITDPTYVAKKRLNVFERCFAALINDVRDLPFIKLSLFYLASVVPAAVYLFASRDFHWALGFVYLLVLYSTMVGPYVLMLHNVCHRKLFKRKYEKLNHVIVWLLGPFFGETPETYYIHHVGMHHREENLPADLSSTMKYQRDSFIHFLRYFLRFFFFIPVEMGLYLRRRKRTKLFKKMILGELSWYLWMALLCFWNWQATLVVFIIPLVVTRFMMINGNWAQHAFVSQEAPHNSFQSSITCINSRYNRTCFNDGYHIGHHLDATRHWTEMPEDFLKNKKTYIEEKAVVFEKLDYLLIWFALMLKRYRWLARFYVNLDDKNPLNQEEIVGLLKSRTRPFHKDALQSALLSV
jgi:hypothetical protein